MIIRIFKYLWIVVLLLAYIAGWVHAIRDLIYVAKNYKFKFWSAFLDEFSTAWFGVHALMVVMISFLIFVWG